jgi:hypothetical protein
MLDQKGNVGRLLMGWAGSFASFPHIFMDHGQNLVDEF